MTPKGPEKFKPSEEEEESKTQPLAQREDLGNSIAEDLATEKETNESKRKRAAGEFFDEATSSSPDQSKLNEILKKWGDAVLRQIAIICLDRMDPNGDSRWGKVRKAIGNYSQTSLRIFNQLVIAEARRRGREY